MARSDCCFFLIASCLILLLPPALAKREKIASIASLPANACPPPPSQKDAASKTTISVSLSMILRSRKGKSFTKHICQYAADPSTCSKVIKGSDEFLSSLKPGVSAMLSVELSAAIAAKAGAYMQDKLKDNRIKPAAVPFVQSCITHYQNAIADFNTAYANFQVDPVMAIKGLKEVGIKLGLCDQCLKKGGEDANLPRIHGTNNLLRSLIQAVSKEVSLPPPTPISIPTPSPPPVPLPTPTQIPNPVPIAGPKPVSTLSPPPVPIPTATPNPIRNPVSIPTPIPVSHRVQGKSI